MSALGARNERPRVPERFDPEPCKGSLPGGFRESAVNCRCRSACFSRPEEINRGTLNSSFEKWPEWWPTVPPIPQGFTMSALGARNERPRDPERFDPEPCKGSLPGGFRESAVNYRCRSACFSRPEEY